MAGRVAVRLDGHTMRYNNTHVHVQGRASDWSELFCFFGERATVQLCIDVMYGAFSEYVHIRVWCTVRV